MDNRINEIRCKMGVLRVEMTRVEDAMRDQIKHDLDCTESALRLMAMRTEMAALVAEWKAAGGVNRCRPCEGLSANNRSAQKPKAATHH